MVEDAFVLDAAMPALTDLFISAGLFEGEVSGDFALAPNLRQLYADGEHDVSSLPSSVVDLVTQGKTVPDLPALPLLERLQIKSPVDAGALIRFPTLRWLGLSYPTKGVGPLLRTLIDLELLQLDLEAVRVARLELLGRKPRLRDCTLMSAGLRSLDGIEGWPQIERLKLHHTGVTDLAPLADSVVRELTIVAAPSAAPRFALAPIGRMKQLRSVHLDLESAVESLGDWSAATELEDVWLGETLLGERGLDGLVELPQLRSLALGRRNRVAVERFAAQRPDVRIVMGGQREVTSRVGLIEIHELKPSGWGILQDLTGHLDVATNYAAEAKIRAQLELSDSTGLDFDTEASRVGIYAAERLAIERVAAVISRLER